MNQIAQEMNEQLEKNSKTFHYLLSDFGKKIYMPKGIISQSAEASKLANKFNATIGIAKEKNSPMYLNSMKKYFNDLTPQEIFPYASPFGIPALRESWKEKIISENPLLKNKDSISTPVVTQALTHGLMLAADLFINPDDEIIMPDKLWGNYRLIFEVRYNAKIKTYPLFNSSLTGFDCNALEDAIANSKKEKIILLFNFPNNPSGYTLTNNEAEKIKDIVLKFAKKGKKILILSDEAYFSLFFDDDILKSSIFSKFVGLHENIAAVKIDGFTKEFYVWGFRIGFITFGDYQQNSDAYSILEKKTAAAIRCSISNCSNPAQSILLKAESDPAFNNEKKEKYEILKARALKVKEVVYNPKFSDYWDVYPFNSGYFMCLRLKDIKSEDLRVYALKQYGLGTISIGETDLRVAFSSVELEEIEEIFETLAKCIKELKK